MRNRATRPQSATKCSQLLPLKATHTPTPTPKHPDHYPLRWVTALRPHKTHCCVAKHACSLALACCANASAAVPLPPVPTAAASVQTQQQPAAVQRTVAHPALLLLLSFTLAGPAAAAAAAGCGAAQAARGKRHSDKSLISRQCSVAKPDSLEQVAASQHMRPVAGARHLVAASNTPRQTPPHLLEHTPDLALVRS